MKRNEALGLFNAFVEHCAPHTSCPYVDSRGTEPCEFCETVSALRDYIRLDTGDTPPWRHERSQLPDGSPGMCRRCQDDNAGHSPCPVPPGVTRVHGEPPFYRLLRPC